MLFVVSESLTADSHLPTLTQKMRDCLLIGWMNTGVLVGACSSARGKSQRMSGLSTPICGLCSPIPFFQPLSNLSSFCHRDHSRVKLAVDRLLTLSVLLMFSARFQCFGFLSCTQCFDQVIKFRSNQTMASGKFCLNMTWNKNREKSDTE